MKGLRGQFHDVDYRLVPEAQAKRFVKDRDALRHVVQYCLQMRMLAPEFGFDLLAFGNVLGGTACPQRLSLTIEIRSAVMQDVAQLPDGVDDPVFHLVWLAVGSVLRHGLRNPLPVFGVHMLQKQPVGGRDASGRVTEQTIAFVGPPKLIGAQVALPVADAADMLSFEQQREMSLVDRCRGAGREFTIGCEAESGAEWRMLFQVGLAFRGLRLG